MAFIKGILQGGKEIDGEQVGRVKRKGKKEKEEKRGEICDDTTGRTRERSKESRFSFKPGTGPSKKKSGDGTEEG